jgi:hypothetical protein
MDQSSIDPLQGASRTVDLLIEFQKRRAGLSFDAPSRPVDRSNSGAPLANKLQPSAVINSSSVMFGTGLDTAMAGKDLKMGNGDWKAVPGPDAKGPAVSTKADAGRTQETEVGGRMPLVGELLQFVRNNRALVGITALAALLLVWAGSVTVSQRRR